MNRERRGVLQRGVILQRRTVLRGVAALAGIAAGNGTASAGFEIDASERVRRQVGVDLQPGVTLFDLDGDGEYGATVERAPEGMRDDDHPEPIHVTSGGRSTVDYAVSVAEPPEGTTLGGLDQLSYDYYQGADEADAGTASETITAEDDDATESDESGDADDGLAPGEPFLVVENDDGRHGAYLESTDDPDDSDATGPNATDQAVEEWRTFDVLDRMEGGAAGESRWFEYTAVEDGYEGQTFQDVFGRFGEEARLVLIGVGHGDAVTPAILDAYYDNLAVDGETLRFPASVANRVS